MQQARAHFEAGRALYRVGNYNDAVREFSAGYALAPQKPQFLLNLGQCYRKLDDLEKARDMYSRYLRAAPPNETERAQAQQILSEIEAQLAARPPSESPETTHVTPAPAAPLLVHDTPVVATTPAPTPPPQKSFIRRNWWIIPVTVVVAGVAIGVGVYYGTRTNVCDGATLGCFPVQ